MNNPADSQPRPTPDPENARLLARCLRADQETGRVGLLEAAASNRRGEVHFSVGQHFRIYRVEEPGPGTVTIESVDVLPLLGGHIC